MLLDLLTSLVTWMRITEAATSATPTGATSIVSTAGERTQNLNNVRFAVSAQIGLHILMTTNLHAIALDKGYMTCHTDRPSLGCQICRYVRQLPIAPSQNPELNSIHLACMDH